MIKRVLLLLVAVIIFATASCGTILKNGKGGKSNKIDIPIVVLDSFALALFLIPGIIALSVDYSNKTIYK